MPGQRWLGSAGSFQRRLLLISLVGLALRLAYVLVIERGDPLTGDALYYHHAANLLADGKGFVEPFRYLYGGAQDCVFVEDCTDVSRNAAALLPVGHEEPTAGHPPLWIVVTAIPSVLGFTSVLSHQLFSAFVGSFSIVVVGLLGRELRSERVGLVAAAIAATYAFMWMSDGMIMSESLVVILAAAASLVGLRFWRAPDASGAIVFGVIGALAALTRAEVALFLPVLAAVALLRSTLGWWRRAALYTICGGVALLTISPWLIRNAAQFEEPVFLSNGAGILLAQTNCDETYFGDKRGYWEFQCGLPQAVGEDGRLLDESERDIVYRERGVDYITDHTARLVTHAIPWRVGRVWALYQPVQQLRADILVEGRTFKLSVLGLVQYYVLVPLSIFGAVLTWRRKDGLAAVGLWVPLVTLTVALAFGTTRYRASAEVSIVVLAAVTIDWLIGRRVGDPTTT